MIITRSPLRISLGGGGTDLPSYYKDHEGFLIAGAIDKYVYITLHKTFEPGFIIKYSELEKPQQVDEIKHPIIREALREMGVKDPFLEITSMADIPTGTGLGSSGSFTTALLKALSVLQKKVLGPHELAELACDIELNKLREPIGKQDQFIASFGGLTTFRFLKDGSVKSEALKVSEETLRGLEENLHLFFTGIKRSASEVLRDQNQKSLEKNQEMLENLHFIKDLGFQSKVALESGDLATFAELMDTHWQKKKKRSKDMSNSTINEVYDFALKNGALGGKLIGAGGGGFLMFLSRDRNLLRKAMTSKGFQEVRFKFDFEGTKVVVAP